MKTVIYGGEVHQKDKVLRNGYIVIENSRISKIQDFSDCNFDDSQLEALVNAENPDQMIDSTGMIVAPGSIDMHTHGFSQKEFLGATQDDLGHMLGEYPRFGVTSVSPTLMTSSIKRLSSTLKNISRYHEESMKRKKFAANLLSCYLEGRYFGIKKSGAHDIDELVNDERKYKKNHGLVNDSRNLVEIILDEISGLNSAARGFINVISIDPSLEGASRLIRILSEKGYRIAVGHTNCTYAQAIEAISNGATILIHAFNAIGMSGDQNGGRLKKCLDIENCLGACLDSERIYAEIIADLVHVKECYVKMIGNRKGVDKIILITDSCSAAGTNERQCVLNGKNIFIKGVNGHDPAAYTESDVLCGSLLTMNQAIKNAVNVGYTLNEAFLMASYNPAKALGISENRGCIEEKKYADIAIYSRGFRLKNQEDGEFYGNTIDKALCILVEGNIAYISEEFKEKMKGGVKNGK